MLHSEYVQWEATDVTSKADDCYT